MFLLQQILPSALLALVAGVGLLLIGRVLRWHSALLESAAVALAYAAGHAWLVGRPAFPPVEATGWLFYGTVLALGAAALDRAVAGRPPRRRLAGGRGFAAGRLLRPLENPPWTPLLPAGDL